MRAFALAVVATLTLSVAAGCGSTSEDGAIDTDAVNLNPRDDSSGNVGDEDLSDDALVAADDTNPAKEANVSALFTATKAITTAAVNLRAAASTTAAVLVVMPEGAIVTLNSRTPSNGFYDVTYNGIRGYAHANYLTPFADAGTPGDVDGPPSPATALARARTSVGFSYYWGGGAWLASGPSSSTAGACAGNCPSCTHSGRYGADCSGMVAKAWQFGAKDLSTNAHPYSTANFNVDASGKWSTVSKDEMRPGDALVHNANGAGHIVIYEKGDGWGAPTVYECRGCAYGCVYNARSFPATYHAIRRAGF